MFASFLHGRAFVLFALVVVQGLMLLRSVAVARFLGPEQFGIAITFVLFQQFMDMATDTGLNKYLLQSREGNRSAVQGTVQLIATVRGAIAATLVVALGYPLLSGLGLVQTVYPFLILAGSALALGFVHFDNARLQRREVYLNESISNMIGEAVGLMTAIVALLFIRDYTVMLYAMLGRSIAIATASHLLAQRRYSLRYDRGAAAPMWIFIRPLLVNGPLLFLSAQADRVLVGSVLGPLELGIYSAALLLVWTPSGLFTRFLGTTYMPRLAAERRNGLGTSVENEFKTIVVLGFVATATGFTALGAAAIRLLYGDAYSSDFVVISLIGCAQALRFMRTWPNGLALAGGHTGTVLGANLMRFAALPLGLIGLIVEQGLLGLALGLLAGELISLAGAIVLLNRKNARPLMSDLTIVGAAGALSIGMPLLVWSVGATDWTVLVIGIAIGVPAFAAVYLRAFGRPDFRALVRGLRAR